MPCFIGFLISEVARHCSRPNKLAKLTCLVGRVFLEADSEDPDAAGEAEMMWILEQTC
jgi:hypothetical protein